MYNTYSADQFSVDRRPYGYGYGGFGSVFYPLLFLSLINRPPYYYPPYYGPYPYYGYPYGPYPYY